ncbi:MAG: HAD family phosphatase [Candidatus Bathyarchaeota archaeon]|nr:HAD family phosphatase [Candidatus Termiticorpusculum sp.]
MFDTVIFDWDGTLANTHSVIVSCFQETLQEVCGLNVTRGSIERCIGIGAAETFREIFRQRKMLFNEELILQLVEIKSRKQIIQRNSVQLLAGAFELLEILRQREIKVGLASMNSRVVIDALIDTKGLGKYFKAVVTADEVEYVKPHPEIFLKCAYNLDSLLANCVVIEDSVFGVKAAKKAGMRCIAVATGVYSEKELEQEKPDCIVASLKSAKLYDFVLR